MRSWLPLLLLALAAPAAAQDAPEAEAEPEPLPIAAAAWCEVVSGEDPAEAEAEESVEGCDVGVAAALYRFRRWPRLSVVGALGSHSLGPGLGYVFHRSAAGTAYGIGLGVTVPWGSRGIDVSEWGLSLGATLSFARPDR